MRRRQRLAVATHGTGCDRRTAVRDRCSARVAAHELGGAAHDKSERQFPLASVTMDNTMISPALQSAEDLHFMDKAVLMAEEALAAQEIPVGCVLVKDGQLIARGRNRTNEGRNATLHAEFDALRHLLPARTHALTPDLERPFTPQNSDKHAHAARKIYTTPLTGVVLYVTVEPCLMCASAMRQVGIERVIYGCANDRFGGCGGVQSINKEYVPPPATLGLYGPVPDFSIRRRTPPLEDTVARRRSCSSAASTSPRMSTVGLPCPRDSLIVPAPKPKSKTTRVLKHEIVGFIGGSNSNTTTPPAT